MTTVITAPESLDGRSRSVFLAGGIQGCEDWQAKVISLIYGTNAVLFNPRRPGFDTFSDLQIQQQIAWEYCAIRACDIFSMWFCASESVQPICMFELGAALEMDKPIVLGVEPGYLREKDVMFQVTMKDGNVWHRRAKTIEEHAHNIQTASYFG